MSAYDLLKKNGHPQGSDFLFFPVFADILSGYIIYAKFVRFLKRPLPGKMRGETGRVVSLLYQFFSNLSTFAVACFSPRSQSATATTQSENCLASLPFINWLGSQFPVTGWGSQFPVRSIFQSVHSSNISVPWGAKENWIWVRFLDLLYWLFCMVIGRTP